MKYYTFKNELNNFTELLSDVNIKTAIKQKISWSNHMILGFSDSSANNQLFGYIILKYGDMIVNHVAKDYTPIPNVDYVPKKS